MQKKHYITVFLIAICMVFLAGIYTTAAGLAPEIAPDADIEREWNTVQMRQMGGDTMAVAVQDTRAYVSIGPRIFTLDISNPAAPVRLGMSEVYTGTHTDLAIAGDHLFALEKIVDPLGVWGGIRVLDISDPGQIKMEGYYTNTHQPVDAEIYGNLLFVVDCGYGLRIYDISTPQVMNQIGYFREPNDYDQFWDVHLQGNYAYLAAEHSGLIIVDISNPAEPQQVGQYATETPYSYGRGVYVLDSYAYLGNIGYFSVLDISDPQHPAEIGSTFSSGHNYNFYQVGVADGLAWVITEYFDAGEYALQNIDITDPTHPVLLGKHVVKETLEAFVLIGNQAFLAAGADGLQIMDLSDADHPQEIGEFDPWGQMEIRVVQGDKGYGNGMTVFDLSNPLDPRPLGALDLPGKVWAVADNLAFVGGRTDESAWETPLYLVDVSDPTVPAVVAEYVVPNQIQALAVDGDYAYLGNLYELRILDISRPAEVTVTGIYTSPTKIGGIAVVGDYALLANSYSLLTIDFSDPTNPMLVNEYSSGSNECLRVYGNYAYTCHGDDINRYDISNPVQPVQVNEFSGYGDSDVYDVALLGDFLFTSRGSYGMEIFQNQDIGDGLYYPLSGYFVTADQLYDQVQQVGDYIYLNSEYAGLYIVWAGPRWQQTVPVTGTTITYPGSKITLEFDEGAFNAEADVYTTPLYPLGQDLQGWLHYGPVFETMAVVNNESADPSKAYTLTVSLDNLAMGDIFPAGLGLYYWDGAAWHLDPSASVNEAQGVVTTHTDRLGRWAVLAGARMVYLPALNR